MIARSDSKVAVLLATHNGARFVEPQIRSLKDNESRFTLHWLDDHSTDDTRNVVRIAALRSDIELREWHHPQHLGYPGAFFQLLECAEANIYLFCDQDDIWQPGKIDVAAASLLPDLTSPKFCFSDPLLFNEDEPELLRRLSDVVGIEISVALHESRVFMWTPLGHTIGFTRALRELFLRTKGIAHTHAAGHDCWMYILAQTSGTPRFLSGAPTTLYRRHESNFSEPFFSAVGAGAGKLARMWRLQQLSRPLIARQAYGFMLASSVLPPGPKLQRMLTTAKLVAALSQRQSPIALARLAHHGAMFPLSDFALSLTIACLLSDAKA